MNPEYSLTFILEFAVIYLSSFFWITEFKEFGANQTSHAIN
jgi:hypothetical protein